MSATSHRILPFPFAPPSSLSESLMQGPSPAMARLLSQIRRVAPYFRAALLTGEAGCGFEAAARTLHALSSVATLRFRSFDAARAEAELTAARAPALSGFLFFSQVEQMTLSTQRALLRRLRQRDNKLRVAAATHNELRASVSAGRFDATLAEMLSAVRISVPALRERSEDMRLLTDAMLQKAGWTGVVHEEFHAEAQRFAWPGNFPQLRDVMARAAALGAETGELRAGHFETACAAAANIQAPAALQPAAPRMIKLDEVVADHVRAVLVGCGGNKLRAADILGISRSTLYRILDAASVAAPLAKAS